MAFPPAMQVVRNRKGKVLTSGTLLKTDLFPQSNRNKAMEMRLLGAPNFRTVHNYNMWVSAVAQADVSGIRAVLRWLRYRDGAPNGVVWHNLREEPVIYVNSRPFVLRTLAKPFQNLGMYTGISSERVEEMELRLKEDVLMEAQEFGGLVLVHDETTEGEILGYWVAVDDWSVRTPHEVVMEKLQGEGVIYRRLPITAESPPLSSSLDEMLRMLLSTQPQKQHVVFNCQMGVGRSTYAMVVALLYQSSLLPALRETEHRLQRTEHRVVHRLVSTLPHGVQEQVDYVIDLCDSMRNLRNDVVKSRLKAQAARTTERQEAHWKRAIVAMERYLYLIALNAYLWEHPPKQDGAWPAFESWVESHPHIGGLIDYLKENPEEAIGSTAGVEGINSRAEDGEFDLVVKERKGQLLHSMMMIKADQLRYNEEEGEEFSKAHDMVYGKVDHLNVFRTSLASADNLLLVQDAIGQSGLASPRSHSSMPEKAPPLWINLREEPHVFIGDQSFVLRHMNRPLVNIRDFMGISATDLEALEERLAEEIRHELLRYGSRIVVHDEKQDCRVYGYWLSTSLGSVRTPAQMLENLMREQQLEGKYVRIPCTAGHAITDERMDEIVCEIVHLPFGTPIVFVGAQGGRSQIAFITAALVHTARFAQSHFALDVVDRCKEREEGTFAIINSLLRLLNDGLRFRAEVDAVIELVGVNMFQRLDVVASLVQKSRSMEEADVQSATASMQVLRYVSLIVFNAYCNDKDSIVQGNSLHFSQWMKNRGELTKLQCDIVKDPHKALQYMPLGLDTNRHMDLGSLEGAVAHRKGAVLASNTILKNDHFPGCQRGHFRPQIHGAPNYRCIRTGRIHIHGCAMATKAGIRGVLDHVDARASGVKRDLVVWVNMREEPVVYVNGGPYVLRDRRRPFENLEHSGINYKRVEAMEERLRVDVLEEMKVLDGKVIVHEETDDGGLEARAVVVEENDVLTTRAMFNFLVDEYEYKVFFARVPVTDEKPPEPGDFEDLVDLLMPHILGYGLNRGEPTPHIVLNCQMGRGRTTTAMCVASLLCRWLRPLERPVAVEQQEEGERGSSTPTRKRLAARRAFDVKHLTDLAVEDSVATMSSSVAPETPGGGQYRRMIAGDYEVISALVRVLDKGSEVKRMVDAVIDASSKMQHLRESIFDFKLKAESMEEDEATRKQAYQRAVQYLDRYFLLILFNGYLSAESGHGLGKTFTEWIDERQELKTLRSRVRTGGLS